MAYREVPMADIDQVIRRWLAGEKIRAIARATGADRNTVRRIVRFAQDAGIQGDTPWPDENKLQSIRQGPSEMTKIEPWTQEELEERRQSELRQSEASSSWYSLTLKIGVAVLLVGSLVALLWPAIAHR